MNSLFLIAAATTAAMGSPVEGNTPAPDETGSIKGQVTFEGERPEAKPDFVVKEKESEGCKHTDGMDLKNRSLLIGESGGVANVVFTVEVKDMDVEVPSEPLVVDQLGCRFEPHVKVLPVGATVRFDNSDDTNHNIHTYAKKNDSVNKNVAGGTSFEQVLDKAEVIDIKCDIHPWMKGYVVVTDDARWALSGKDGSFQITGLPPGSYKLSWWHEELGKGKTEEVVVTAGEVTSVMHKVGAEKKKGGGRRRR